MSYIDLFREAGNTTIRQFNFATNDEVFGVAKNMWYQNPNKAMVWGVLTAGIALATTYNKKIAIAAAFLDPFISRACTAHKNKTAAAIPPALQRKRMIGAMIAGTSAIATGVILLDALKNTSQKHNKKTSQPYDKILKCKDGQNV